MKSKIKWEQRLCEYGNAAPNYYFFWTVMEIDINKRYILR